MAGAALSVPMMFVEKFLFFTQVQSAKHHRARSVCRLCMFDGFGLRDGMDSIVMSERRSVIYKAILLAVCSCCFGASAQAAEIPWPEKARFQYVAQKKDLRELLREFSLSQGLTVAVADGLDGSVSGRFDLKPQAMLELLAASHGFLWYYDGSLLHIAPSTDVRTEVIQLRFTPVDQVVSTLSRLNILDKRYPLHLDRDGSTILVSGPGRYVELVSQISDNVELKNSHNQATEVRVFPLRFAWAADHEFSSGGQSVVVPGVASTLSSLYQPAGGGRQALGAPAARKVAAMKPGAAELPGTQAKAPVARTDSSKLGGISEASEKLPVIQASAQINAVVIRDNASKMAQYAELIEKLDIRPEMIEIEARVIEVSSDEAEKFGVDWRINSAGTPSADNSLARLDAVRSFTNGGGVMKSILANAGLNFLERISMLEAQGKASVTASPTVLTLNNLEARMDNQETFYVRVAGYQSSELFNISAGVTLRVTPMIVAGSSGQRIKLDVRIEDGRIDNAQTVDQIPTVNRSEISTQGFVNNGESLLIAGYSLEQDLNNTANVRGLAKLPLFGGLFRNNATSKIKTQRLFLLTPRIVGAQAQDGLPIAKPSVHSEPGVDGIALTPDTALILREHLKSGRTAESAAVAAPNAASATPLVQAAAVAAKAAGAAAPQPAGALPVVQSAAVVAQPPAAAAPVAQIVPAAMKSADVAAPLPATGMPAAQSVPAATPPADAALSHAAAGAPGVQAAPTAAKPAGAEAPAVAGAAPVAQAAPATVKPAESVAPAVVSAAPAAQSAPAEAKPALSPAPRAAGETPVAQAVTAPKPEKIAKEWRISSADNTLKSALSRWSGEAGWQLSWELLVDYPIQARTTIRGSFEEAMEAVASSMDGVQFIFYKANQVLRVVVKGIE